MKKIIFIFLIFFCGIKITSALGVIYTNFYDDTLTDSVGNIYKSYRIRVNDKDHYMLTPSEKYSWNNYAYEEVPLSDFPNIDRIVYLLSYQPVITENGTLYVDRFHLTFSEIIWEEIYQKDFIITKPDTEQYKAIRSSILDKINKIDKGPEFIDEVYNLTIGDTIELTSEILKYFYIYDSDGLNASIIDNKLIINANVSGNHKIVIHRKPNNMGESHLYKNGDFYLLYPGEFTPKDYILDINIPCNIELNFNENTCFKINNSDEVCTEDKKIKLNLDEGNYIFSNNLFQKEIYISSDIKIDITLNESNNIENENVNIDTLNIIDDKKETQINDENTSLNQGEFINNQSREPIFIDDNLLYKDVVDTGIHYKNVIAIIALSLLIIMNIILVFI